MDLIKTCINCSKDVRLPITEEQYNIWRNRPNISIQKMFPALTADEREILLSGICGECYDKLFPEED